MTSTELIPIKQPENWIHYTSSSAQIVMYNKYQQGDEDYGIYRKPKGLWITPEYAHNNWYEWCISEQFREDQLNFIHDVKLKPSAKLLRLENADDIDAFTAKYGSDGISKLLDTKEGKLFGNLLRSIRNDTIDWESVSKEYHGILIPNYIGERRLYPGTDWYYPWDCASGCVWSKAAVESIAVRTTVSAGLVRTKHKSVEEVISEMEELGVKLPSVLLP